MTAGFIETLMRLLNSLLTKLGISEVKVERDPIRVFLLDDDKRRHEWFSARFKKDLVDVADNVEAAQQLLSGAGNRESGEHRPCVNRRALARLPGRAS